MKDCRQKLKTLANDLASLERYIRALVIFLPSPFCTMTPLGVVLEFNPALSKMSGYEANEVIGKNIKDLLPDEDIEGVIEETVEKGEAHRKRMVLVRADGREVPVSLFANARKDKNGGVIGLFVSFFDLSAREEAEKKIREKVEELEKFKEMAVGREVKMVELKEKIKKLQKN